MPPPAKRRRKNDFQPPTAPVRSIDYFFNKQKKDYRLDSEGDCIKHGKCAAENAPAPTLSAGESLTDEDLARRLQEEWNRQDFDQQEEKHPETSAPVESVANSQDGPSDIPFPSLSASYSAVPDEHSNNDARKPEHKHMLSLQSVTRTEDAATYSIPFDSGPLEFEPDAYIPKLKESWAADGGDAAYGLLTSCLSLSTAPRVESRLWIRSSIS
jgi:DNA ligase 1